MYEMRRRITYSEVNRNLQMDMGMIAHFFQDCALFHSESIGKGLEEVKRTMTAWFLSGWQIEVLRYPEYKEEVIVRTWPHDFKSMYGYRNFEILDAKGEPVVRANSIWVFMDLEKGMPKRPTPEDREGYDLEPAIDMEYAERKIKVFDESARVNGLEIKPIPVLPSFLDSNQHVNNGKYVSLCIDYFPERHEVMKMRVDYRRAATLGDTFFIRVYEQGRTRQIILGDKEGTPYVIIEVE